MLEQFIAWYFFEVPGKIKKIWFNYIWFFAAYFALGQLCRDFFAPWKGLTFHREKRAFEFGDAFYAWFSNVFVSRPIGAAVRFFFIAIGGAVELVVLLAGPVAFLAWAAYVPAIFYLFFFGLKLVI